MTDHRTPSAAHNPEAMSSLAASEPSSDACALLLAHAPSVICLVDQHGLIMQANEAVRRRLGLDPASVRGLAWWKLTAAAEQEPLAASWQSMPSEPRQFTVCMPQANGRWSWSTCTCTPTIWQAQPAWVVVIEFGNAIFAMPTDQTERDRLLTEILDATPDLVYLYDLIEQRNVYVNQAIVRLLGYTTSALRAMDGGLLGIIMHPDDFAQLPIHQARLAASAPGEVIELSYRVRHADGSWCWLFERALVFTRTADGVAQQILGIAEDMTERKHAQAELGKRNEQLRLMTDSLPIMVSYLDRDLRYQFNNQAYADWFNVSLEKLRGMTVLELVGDAAFASVKPYLDRVLAGETVRYEQHISYANGRRRWMQVSYIPHQTTNNEVIGFIALINDATDEKEAALALQQAASRLAVLAEASQVFSSTLDLPTLGQRITEAVAAALGDACVLQVISTDGKRVEPLSVQHADPAAKAMLQELITVRPFALGDGLQGRVAATNAPIFLPEVSPDELRGLVAAYWGPYIDQFAPHSLIAVPLRVQDRVIGTLLTVRDMHLNAYTADDQLLLQDLADRAALALNHAVLYGQMQAAVAIAEHHTAQLSGLTEAALAINAALSVETMLRVITEEARKVIDTDEAVTQVFLDGDTQQIIRMVSRGSLRIAARDPYVQRDSSGLYAFVCLTNRPLRLTSDELMAHPAWRSSSTDMQLPLPRRGWLGVPLIARNGHNMGLLQLTDKKSGPFSATDQTILVQLANMAVIALENAQLYQASQAAERAKEESLALLDMIFANAPVGFAVFDPHDLRFVRVNAAMAEMNGVSIEDHLGRSVPEVLPDVAEHVMTELRQVAQTGVPLLNQEIRAETPAAPGVQRYWLSNYYQIRHEAGELLGVGIVVTEITERKRIEMTLRFLSEASTVLSSSLAHHATMRQVAALVVPQLATWCEIYIADPNGKLQLLASAHDAPYHPPLVLGSDPDLIYSPAWVFRSGDSVLIPDLNEFGLPQHDAPHSFMAQLQAQQVRTLLSVPLRASGRLLGTLVLAGASTGRPYDQRDLLLAEDLAQRIAVAIDNALLYREAQAAVRVRDVFLSVASHELRTPITTLMGHAQLLLRRGSRDNSLTERNLKTVQTIADQAQRLTKLVGALLDISRIQTGQLSLEQAPVMLGPLVERVVTEIEPTLHNHTLHAQIADEPVWVDGDAVRLEQVFQNLIQNAVKYSPNGGPLTVTLSSGANEVLFSVQDQGMGIPASALPFLFQRFYRAENVPAEEISGMGIGLYIVQEIVHLHGGQVEVRSTEGVGSTFIVHLPRLQAP